MILNKQQRKKWQRIKVTTPIELMICCHCDRSLGMKCFMVKSGAVCSPKCGESFERNH